MAVPVAIYVHERHGLRPQIVGHGSDDWLAVIHNLAGIARMSTGIRGVLPRGRFRVSILGMGSTHGTSGRPLGPGHPGRTVARTTPATLGLERAAVRWQVTSGRWQRPCRGVVVAHSGPLTDEEQLWAAVLAAGRDAVLGGLTAARLDGLTGFEPPAIQLLVPAARRVRTVLPGVVVHRSLGHHP